MEHCVAFTQQSETFLKTVSGLKSKKIAMAGVAEWFEHQSADQRVTGSIPSHGTCLGCRPGPHLGSHERQPHFDVSLSPFPSV